MRDLVAEGRGRHAEQHAPHAGRISERPEHVENGTDPDLPTNGRGMAHRRVVPRREHETDTGFLDAARDAVGAQIDLYAEGLQHVGTSTRARGGPVPMLRD